MPRPLGVRHPPGNSMYSPMEALRTPLVRVFMESVLHRHDSLDCWLLVIELNLQPVSFQKSKCEEQRGTVRGRLGKKFQPSDPGNHGWFPGNHHPTLLDEAFQKSPHHHKLRCGQKGFVMNNERRSFQIYPACAISEPANKNPMLQQKVLSSVLSLRKLQGF